MHDYTHESVFVNLVPNKKDDPERLMQTLHKMEGVRDVLVNLEQNQVNIKISPALTIQHIINEINIKTGFRAY